MTQVNLVELLRLDREVAAELAEISADVAAAIAEEIQRTSSEPEVPRPWRQARGTPPGDALPPGQRLGHVNPATLRPRDRRIVECATHSVRAATNYLLLDQVDLARGLYSQAADLIEVYSLDDSTTLRLCAFSFEPPQFVTDDEGAGLSPWLHEVRAGILAGLPGAARFPAEFPVASSGGSSTPSGTSAHELQGLLIALLGCEDEEEAAPLLLELDAVVARTSSRFLPAMDSHWWATQDIDASPLEPELLVLALLSECWNQRFAPRGGDESMWVDEGDMADNALAVALRVSAHRLLRSGPRSMDFATQ